MSRVTREERRALEAWWEHETVKGAAAVLGKSPRTVEQQLRTARERLGVTKTAAAVRLLLREEPT